MSVLCAKWSLQEKLQPNKDFPSFLCHPFYWPPPCTPWSLYPQQLCPSGELKKKLEQEEERKEKCDKEKR